MMTAVARHLLDSTVFAGFVLLLVVLLRRQAASVRHMLLLAAVMKFAIPLHWLFALGTSLRRLLPQQVATSYIQLPDLLISPGQSFMPPQQNPLVWQLPLALWLGVTAFLLGRWIVALSKEEQTSVNTSPADAQVLRQAAQRLRMESKVELRTSFEARDPYLAGLFRPILVMPEGLSEMLSMTEYEAILLHELAHAKRWDNLTRSFVHVVVCLFWFFPLLRWLERRIEGEAELACDELVLNMGVKATDYLQSLCKVCQQFLLRPLAGRSHVNSFNLGSRMEHIMSFSPQEKAIPFSTAFGVLSLAAVFLAATVTGFAASPNEAPKSSGQASTNSCVAANHRVPQGTVIRVNNTSALQLCTFSEGRPKWVATTEAARDHSKMVVELSIPTPPQTASCKETEPQGKLCTCDNLGYSPGAVVGSPRGNLVCPASGGRWQAYKGDRMPY